MGERLDEQLVGRPLHAIAILSTGKLQTQILAVLGQAIHLHAEAGNQLQFIEEFGLAALRLSADGPLVVGTGVQALSGVVNLGADASTLVGRQSGKKLLHLYIILSANPS